MKYKHIICSGDSYTAGHELAADQLIPEYFDYAVPAYICHEIDAGKHHDVYSDLRKSHDELKRQLNDLERALERVQDKTASTSYWNMSKQRAWPGKLQSLTGIAVSNLGHYGISNHEIAYRLLETATHALNNHSPENIICFMMLSNPLRFGTPQHGPHHRGEYDYQSFAPWFDFVPETIKPWARRIIEDYNDYDYLHESYINVLAVKSHLTKLGINTIILDSGLWDKFGREYSHPTKQNRFKLFSEILEIQLDPLTKVGFEKGFKKLPGGHMEESLHDLYAEMIVETYLK